MKAITNIDGIIFGVTHDVEHRVPLASCVYMDLDFIQHHNLLCKSPTHNKYNFEASGLIFYTKKVHNAAQEHGTKMSIVVCYLLGSNPFHIYLLVPLCSGHGR